MAKRYRTAAGLKTWADMSDAERAAWNANNSATHRRAQLNSARRARGVPVPYASPSAAQGAATVKAKHAASAASAAFIADLVATAKADAARMSDDDLKRAVAAVGTFNSDTARAYRDEAAKRGLLEA